jgi:hypothetical protein
MVTKELIDYIKKCREQNISDEQIKSTLKEQGWTDEDINAGFSQIPQLTEPVQAAEITKPQKPKKKFLIPLIIIVGILIIGGGIFAYFQFFREGAKTGGEEQKNEIADWKTYKNEEYGFEFKYPDDWIVEDGIADETESIKKGYWIEVSHSEEVGEAEIYGKFGVALFNFNDNNKNFEEDISSVKRLFPDFEEINQNGLSGVRGTNYGQSGVAETMGRLEAFLGDRGVYHVSTYFMDFNDGNYKKQTELIRSTLKFIE